MLEDNLSKFRALPKEVQEAVSGSKAMGVINALQDKFECKLSMLVIRVAIGDVALNDLVNTLRREQNLLPADAGEIARKLEEGIFSKITDFLSKQKESLVKARPLGSGQDDKPTVPKKRGLEEVVEEIISEAGLNIGDQVLKKRFQNIILLRLKDIRDNLETSDALSRPIKIGGLGLEEAKIDQVLKIISQKLETLTADEMLRIKEADKKAEKPKKKKEEKAQPKKTDKQKLDLSHELSPPPPVVLKKRHISYDSNEKRLPEVKQEVRVKQRVVPPPPIRKPEIIRQPSAIKSQRVKEVRREKIIPPVIKLPELQGQVITDARERVRPSVAARPKIEDIKFVSRLVGPQEELARLNLVEFRRIAKDAKTAARKILEKINLLEEDSLSERLEGVKNFRASELFKLYLEIGEQSLLQKMNEEEVIKQRSAAGQATLQPEEFEAIMELNNKLRY